MHILLTKMNNCGYFQAVKKIIRKLCYLVNEEYRFESHFDNKKNIIDILRYLNFGTFYYIIDNFSCCLKFENWRETTCRPNFVSRTLLCTK